MFMRKNQYIIVLLGLIILMMISCSPVPDDNGGQATSMPSATAIPVTPTSETLTLEQAAGQVINALSTRDMETVAAFVHPHQGVRFSPYTFVREEHQVFMAEDLPGLLESDQVYTWGQYDGSGEPIVLTFADYYEEFVYSSEFVDADQVAVNERLGQGNTINNIQEFYPESSFVEYYIPGTEEFGGMDWESLRLVFVQEDGTWMLVGIVHDEWTI